MADLLYTIPGYDSPVTVRSIASGEPIGNRTWVPTTQLGVSYNGTDSYLYYVPYDLVIGGAQNAISGDPFYGKYFYPALSPNALSALQTYNLISVPEEFISPWASNWTGISNPTEGFLLTDAEYRNLYGGGYWRVDSPQFYGLTLDLEASSPVYKNKTYRELDGSPGSWATSLYTLDPTTGSVYTTDSTIYNPQRSEGGLYGLISSGMNALNSLGGAVIGNTFGSPTARQVVDTISPFIPIATMAGLSAATGGAASAAGLPAAAAGAVGGATASLPASLNEQSLVPMAGGAALGAIVGGLLGGSGAEKEIAATTGEPVDIINNVPEFSVNPSLAPDTGLMSNAYVTDAPVLTEPDITSGVAEYASAYADALDSPVRMPTYAFEVDPSLEAFSETLPSLPQYAGGAEGEAAGGAEEGSQSTIGDKIKNELMKSSLKGLLSGGATKKQAISVPQFSVNYSPIGTSTFQALESWKEAASSTVPSGVSASGVGLNPSAGTGFGGLDYGILKAKKNLSPMDFTSFVTPNKLRNMYGILA